MKEERTGLLSCVDVVVPCYNYGRYLAACVDSVLSQADVQVRVLIIDDCSCDDTEHVGRALEGKDMRVEYVRHAKNRGHIATYNEGLLEWARADYSLLLSADDLLAKGALARTTRVLDCHPDVGFAYGMALRFFTQHPPVGLTPDEVEYRIVPSGKFLERCFRHGNAVSTPTAVVRTSLQRELGGYDASLPHSGDMEMWMRFAANAPVGVLRSVQAFYRHHEANMSSQYYARSNSDRREVISTGETVARVWQHRFHEMSEWMDATRVRLAYESFWDASKAIEEYDDTRFQECLAFAEETLPSIRYSREMRRLKLKRALGPRISFQLSRLLSRWSRPHASSQSSNIDGRRLAEEVGWWPGEDEVNERSSGRGLSGFYAK